VACCAVLCCCVQAYKHEAVLGLHVCFVHDTQLWMVMPYMEVSAEDSCCRTQSAAVLSEGSTLSPDLLQWGGTSCSVS
jgi:hypothetical protein